MDQDIMKNMLKRETVRQFEIQKKKDELKLIQPKHEQYNYFTDVFQEKLKEINGMLDSSNKMDQNDLTSNFDKVWKELHQLQKFVADSLMFLRDYDIRICQKSLQDAENKTRKLEEDLLPKKKFGFKNKRKAQVKKPQIVAEDQVDCDQTGCNQKDCNEKECVKNLSRLTEIFSGFKDQKNATLILEDEHLFKKDISLQNLEKCVVKLNGTPSTLHATNLRDCVILCGPVSTSVFAEYCTDCKFALACQQLRVHSSHACDIYLHVTSKAIIEDSRDIRVAKYNYVYANLSRDFEASTLDARANNWAQLEDFNWLVVDKPSPNWRTMQGDECVEDWVKFLQLYE